MEQVAGHGPKVGGEHGFCLPGQVGEGALGGGEGFFRTVFLVVGCGEEVEECHVVGRLGCFGGDGDVGRC